MKATLTEIAGFSCFGGDDSHPKAEVEVIKRAKVNEILWDTLKTLLKKVTFNLVIAFYLRMQNLWSLAQSIPQKTSLPTLGFSTACIVLLIFFRMALRPVCRRYPWIPDPPPIELLLIALSAWLTHEFHLNQRWRLAVLGHIPAGLPQFQPPPVLDIVDWPLVLDALLIAFLITALMLSLVKLYAPDDESLQPNRQLASLGIIVP